MTKANTNLSLIAILCCIVLAIFTGLVTLYGFSAFIRVVGENDANRAERDYYKLKTEEYQKDRKLTEALDATLRYLKVRDNGNPTGNEKQAPTAH